MLWVLFGGQYEIYNHTCVQSRNCGRSFSDTGFGRSPSPSSSLQSIQSLCKLSRTTIHKLGSKTRLLLKQLASRLACTAARNGRRHESALERLSPQQLEWRLHLEQLQRFGISQLFAQQQSQAVYANRHLYRIVKPGNFVYAPLLPGARIALSRVHFVGSRN